MISAQHAEVMARYNQWTNERLFDICSKIPDRDRKADRGAFFRSIHSTLNHIIYGDLAFLSCFTGEPAATRTGNRPV